MIRPATDISFNEEVLVVEALQQLSLVLRPSENSLVKEEDKTLGLYESSIAMMQAQIRALASKNRTLCTELVTQEGQHREIKLLHTAEITALQEENRASKAVVESMRQEMLETMQKAHEMVQASLAREEAAVRVATEFANARVAAAVQETEARVRADYTRQLQQVCSWLDHRSSEIDSVIKAGEGLIRPWTPDSRFDVMAHRNQAELGVYRASKSYFEHIRKMLKEIK